MKGVVWTEVPQSVFHPVAQVRGSEPTPMLKFMFDIESQCQLQTSGIGKTLIFFIGYDVITVQMYDVDITDVMTDAKTD